MPSSSAKACNLIFQRRTREPFAAPAVREYLDGFRTREQIRPHRVLSNQLESPGGTPGGKADRRDASVSHDPGFRWRKQAAHPLTQVRFHQFKTLRMFFDSSHTGTIEEIAP